jgi:hypothetical protein
MKTHISFPAVAVGLGLLAGSAMTPHAGAQAYKYLLDVPDYDWYAGCFGTATGNLMGYWDRNGFTNFYTGPTGGGLAPLDSYGANQTIRSLWANKSGLDGRPANQPGHMDDYWFCYSAGSPTHGYESGDLDPYVLAGRAEHPPDCVGDFIGLNQRKYTNMLGECDGNIDAYSFNFWDTTGNGRTNYTPTGPGGAPLRDIQSGLRAWTRWRGSDAEVFSQLVDFNPNRTGPDGFTYADLKANIDAGYPVLIFMQNYISTYRSIPAYDACHTTAMARANPQIHGILAYGYLENLPEEGYNQAVLVKTSWGNSGIYALPEWLPNFWLPVSVHVRGVIGYHPRPKVRNVARESGNIVITWEGPDSKLYDALAGSTTQVHRYVVEMATQLNPPNFAPVTGPTTDRTETLPDPGGTAFYRVQLLPPP